MVNPQVLKAVPDMPDLVYITVRGWRPEDGIEMVEGVSSTAVECSGLTILVAQEHSCAVVASYSKGLHVNRTPCWLFECRL